MKNRPNNKTRTAIQDTNHSTKSVPAVKPILSKLLKGESVHHQDVIKEHKGQQHRLGITIHRLRHRYGFGDLIQCPRGQHPLKHHYFIAPSDMAKAFEIAERHNLLGVPNEL